MSSLPQEETPLSPQRRRFLRRAAPFLLGVGGTAAYGNQVEPDELRVTHVPIPIVGWPGRESLTVGLLSDFHCDTNRAVHRTRRSVELLLAQKPDAVFLLGDYVSEYARRWAGPAAAALSALTTVPGGVFCVLGNHDWGDGHWHNGSHELVAAALRGAGLTLLRNEAAPLRPAPGVWVVGLDDFCADKQNVADALRGVPPGVCKILLVHEPDYADRSPAGFALQLSGHSHGGQICLPGGHALHYPTYGRRYPKGLQRGPHHPVYTTCGVGMTGPQMRLFCPPEVTVLHLHAA